MYLGEHVQLIKYRLLFHIHMYLRSKAALSILAKSISEGEHCGLPMIGFVAADNCDRRLLDFAARLKILAKSHAAHPTYTTAERGFTGKMAEADAEYVDALARMELRPLPTSHPRTLLVELDVPDVRDMGAANEGAADDDGAADADAAGVATPADTAGAAADTAGATAAAAAAAPAGAAVRATAAPLLLYETPEGLIGPKPPTAQNVPRARTASAVAKAAEKAAKAAEKADQRRTAEAKSQQALAAKAAKAAKAAQAAQAAARVSEDGCKWRECDKPSARNRNFVQCTECEGWWHIMCVGKVLKERAREAKVRRNSACACAHARAQIVV